MFEEFQQLYLSKDPFCVNGILECVYYFFDGNFFVVEEVDAFGYDTISTVPDLSWYLVFLVYDEGGAGDLVFGFGVLGGGVGRDCLVVLIQNVHNDYIYFPDEPKKYITCDILKWNWSCIYMNSILKIRWKLRSQHMMLTEERHLLRIYLNLFTIFIQQVIMPRIQKISVLVQIVHH